MEKAKISDVLNGLDASDRQELLDQLEYESRAEIVPFSDNEMIVWLEINLILHSNRPIDRFFASSGNHVSREQYTEDVEELMAFLTRGSRGSLSKVQQHALIGTALQCLVSYLERGRAPIMHRTLVRSLEKIMAAVDRAFPGYAQAGLLGMTVRPPERL